MNPSLKFILILLISFEISFIINLKANIIVVIFCALYLLWHKIPAKTWLLLLVAPIIPVVSIWFAIYMAPAHSMAMAWAISTRVYVFVFTGACLTQTITINDLIRSFEQNLKMPSKFAYGFLAAFNVLPKMVEEVKRIHIAGLMRGENLSFWSPRLYFKAILAALNWSNGLTQGMISHGYREGAKRGVLTKISLTTRDWLYFALYLVAFELLVIFVH